MAQVTVTIDGKAYRMACEEGQEDHLSDLATRFDQYVGHLKAQFGEIGDLRLTVMLGVTFLGLFLTPVFYVALRSLRRKRAPAAEAVPAPGE